MRLKALRLKVETRKDNIRDFTLIDKKILSLYLIATSYHLVLSSAHSLAIITPLSASGSIHSTYQRLGEFSSAVLRGVQFSKMQSSLEKQSNKAMKQ